MNGFFYNAAPRRACRSVFAAATQRAALAGVPAGVVPEGAFARFDASAGRDAAAHHGDAGGKLPDHSLGPLSARFVALTEAVPFVAGTRTTGADLPASAAGLLGSIKPRKLVHAPLDGPAAAVTASSYRVDGRVARFLSPLAARAGSLLEARRLSGVRDHQKLAGTFASAWHQVGNMVGGATSTAVADVVAAAAAAAPRRWV